LDYIREILSLNAEVELHRVRLVSGSLSLSSFIAKMWEFVQWSQLCHVWMMPGIQGQPFAKCHDDEPVFGIDIGSMSLDRSWYFENVRSCFLCGYFKNGIGSLVLL
jgi:hypothetical protein